MFFLLYIYKNGINIGILVIGEFFNGDLLDGKKVYEMILFYFIISMEMIFNKVYNLGKIMLNKFYL